MSGAARWFATILVHIAIIGNLCLNAMIFRYCSFNKVLSDGIVLFVLLSLLQLLLPLSATELSPAQLRGKEIYQNGKGENGSDIEVRIAGDIWLTADQHPCVQCHGSNGKGGLDGGILIPDISWDRLTAPYGVPAILGGIRPSYNKQHLAAAIRRGIASSGERLDVMMPHYRLNDHELDDLIAYLTVIDKKDTPGIDAAVIRIGALISDKHPTSGFVATFLQKYFDEINKRGGIHGRHIELLIRDPGDSGSSALEAARTLVNGKQQVFCLLASAGTANDPEVLKFLQQRDIPLLGPLTFAQDDSHGKEVYYLLASLEDEAGAAARYLKLYSSPTTVKIAVVYADSQIYRGISRGFLLSAKSLGLPITSTISFEDNFETGSIKKLYADDIRLVVFFGNPIQLQQLTGALRDSKWEPAVMFSSVLSGGSIDGYQKTILITPPLAPDTSHPGYRKFHSLLQRSRSSLNDVAGVEQAALPMLMLSYATAQLTTAVLTSTGRNLNREDFLRNLRGLHDFESGVMPPISFGPNRRAGVRGALIIANLRELNLLNQWIEPLD